MTHACGDHARVRRVKEPVPVCLGGTYYYMRISESCAACLYDKQKNKTNNEEYLKEIRNLIDNR